MGVVAKEVKAMSQENILAFEKAGEVIIAGHCLKLTDIKVLILFLLKQYIINISVTICLRFIFKYWSCVCVYVLPWQHLILDAVEWLAE